MGLYEEIADGVINGKAKVVEELVSKALSEGKTASEILNLGLVAGMNVVSEDFKNNEIFVPEVLVAARAMNMGLKVLKPALNEEGAEPIGKAVVCTVKGDMHDIGKNLVKMMLEGRGIECIDLGADVDKEQVVNAVKESNAKLVCLSALLTTTMGYQKEIIDALKDAGLRDQVKIMVGGAPITQEFADGIGADYYTLDAGSAADIAERVLKTGA